MVFRLHAFGGLWIEGPDGLLGGAASQRRRLALLALLAVAGEKGSSRDKLVGYLWPESDEERARHALAQAVYSTRRDFGQALVAGTAQLRLDPEAVSSDVGDFESALAAGDVATASALYAGPFLDGIYLPDAPEFGRWVEAERERLSRLAARALESMAADAAAAGDHAQAVDWWRRLALLDPLSSRFAVGLITAMAAAGDRAGALQHARVHAALVREELEVDPDPMLASVVERLRASAPPAELPEPAATEGRLRAPAESAPASESPQHPAVLPRPSAGGDPLGAIGPAAPSARRRPLLVPLVVAGAAVVLLGGAVLFTQSRLARTALARTLAPVTSWFTGRPAATGARWVLVTDFANSTGDSVFDGTLSTALAASLQQSGYINVVPRARIAAALRRMERPPSGVRIDETLGREIAEREGVNAVVTGSIAQLGGEYNLIGRVVDPLSGQDLATASVRARGKDEMFDALDDLAARLRQALGEPHAAVARTAAALPALTTSSLDALKAYADGARAFDAGKLEQAEQRWSTAIALDSGFAMAYAALGGAYYWNNDRPNGERQFVRALALAPGLPERERLIIQEQIEGWRGNRKGAIELLRTLVREAPDDRQALFDLGYNLMRERHPREALQVYARLTAIDSMDPSAYINIASSYGILGDDRAAVQAYHRAFLLDSSLETTAYLNQEYGNKLIRLGRFDTARAVFRKMFAGPPGTAARGHRSLAYLAMIRGHYGAALPELRQAILLNHVDTAPKSELRDRLQLATVLRLLGRDAQAQAQLDSVYVIAQAGYLEPGFLRLAGRQFARAGDLRRTRVLLDSMTARVHGSSSADRVDLQLLRAELALAQRRWPDALHALEIASALDSSVSTLEPHALALANAGRTDEAVALYERVQSSTSYTQEELPLVQYAPYWLGILLEQRGDREQAARSFERFLATWPDPADTPAAVRDARGRLERLRALRGEG